MLLSYPVDLVNPVKVSLLDRKTAFAVLLAFLLACSSKAGIAQEIAGLPELPNGTLGFVVVRDLGGLDASLQRLLRPWGLRFAGVERTLKAVCPGLSLPSRPLLIGLTEVDHRLVPFLWLPVEDVDALAEAIHADRAREDLIVTIASYDLKITPIAQGVSVQPLGANLFNRPGDNPFRAMKQSLGDSLVILSLTSEGLERMAQQLTEERGRNRPTRPRLLRLRTLADLWSARSLLPAYAPLMERLASEAKSLTIRLRVYPRSHSEVSSGRERPKYQIVGEHAAKSPVEEGGFQLSCEAVGVEAPFDREVKSGSLRTSPDQLADGRKLILSLEANRPLPATLTRLAMAWMESRPDQIDAERYASPEFAAYAESVEMLVASITSFRLALATPHADEPLTANQATLFQVRPGTSTAQLVTQAMVRWNEVVRSSKARTPLEVEIIPLDGNGIRLSTDLVAAMGGPEVEGMVPLLERFYGPKGVRTVDYVPLKEGKRWLSTSYAAVTKAELLEQLLADGLLSDAPGKPRESGGKLWIDRWFAWQQRIEDVGNEQTLGRRVRPPMREAAPLQFSILEENDRIRMDFRLSANAYEALTEYWIAKKVPAK